MTESIGKVMEVFLPEEYNNGLLLDIMERTKIGFKIMTDTGIKEIILNQDQDNTRIMKNDLVKIKEIIEDNNHFIKLELCGDDFE